MATITILNEDIRNTFYYVATIEITLRKEFAHVEGNKKHLDKLVPDYLAGKYSNKLGHALAFTDSISKTAYNAGIVLLVGTFERIVLAKYKTSSGNAKSILRDHKGDKFDYYASRERFLTNIEKLSEIIELITGVVDATLLKKLSEIKERRNEIAHGNVNSMVASVDYTLEEIAKVLDDVIRAIEDR